MKKLTLIFTLLFSTLMFSTPSYGEWTKIGEGAIDIGSSFYVDFERIRKNGGYLYFWSLVSLLKPDQSGDLSNQFYVQGDCKLFKWKVLTGYYYKKPMGEGSIRDSHTPKNPTWQYPLPNSIREEILQRVCNH